MTAAPITFRSTPRANYQPSFEEVKNHFAEGRLVPIYRTLPADLETPVSVFLKLMRPAEPCFLLESVEGGESIARYSFLGVNPAVVLTTKGRRVTERRGDNVHEYELATDQDALDAIKAAVDQAQPVHLPGLPRFVGGAVGFLSYDYVRNVERLPTTAIDELNMPDAAFMLADTLVVFDHVKHQLIILSNARESVRESGEQPDPRSAYQDAITRIEAVIERLRAPLPDLLPTMPPPTLEAHDADPAVMSANVTQAEYEDMVSRAKEYIAAGDCFQIVPSQRFTRETSADPFTIYRSLRMLNPSPYMFFLHFPALDVHVIGASPELMVRYDVDTRLATVRPIAGTAPRGATPAEDAANAQHMITDPKERAEHVMLVDLGRNDLGRVCDYGSVRVPEMFVTERYSHVMHIVSHVEGTLRQEMDAYDLVRATFPAGTLTGAPKIRAMEVIEELEGTRRGLYGGAVGYFSYDGSMDTCIAIRTLLMRGNRLYIQAGAGVVADSDPTKEYHESVNKARAVAIAVENAERGTF